MTDADPLQTLALFYRAVLTEGTAQPDSPVVTCWVIERERYGSRNYLQGSTFWTGKITWGLDLEGAIRWSTRMSAEESLKNMRASMPGLEDAELGAWSLRPNVSELLDIAKTREELES